jgi:predicted nucleic acid-binding protein
LILTAVIDTPSLIYLLKLEQKKSFLYLLGSLFSVIHFPTEVVKEFAAGDKRESDLEWLLAKLHPHRGFYRYCSTYDSLILGMIVGENGIDKGEAEAYAQYKKIQAHVIISDDKKFEKSICRIDPYVKIYSVLHLLCLLDCQKYIDDWNGIVKQFHSIRKFESADLREAYIAVTKQIGVEMTKKELSRKCSLSKMR